MHHTTTREYCFSRTCFAFRARLVCLALKAVTPIDGMYEDTPTGRALLESYNARPIEEAYEIIAKQRIFPFCVSCDHPIVDGKPHMGNCAEERNDCHHLSAAGSNLCTCCSDSMIYKCLNEDCNSSAVVEGLCATCFTHLLAQLTVLADVTPMFLATLPADSPECIAYAEGVITNQTPPRVAALLRSSAELRIAANAQLVRTLNHELDPVEMARLQRFFNESVGSAT